MNDSRHEDLLYQTAEAVREGKLNAARKYVEQVLKEDRDNAQAWMWLYRISSSQGEKIKALKNVLRVDPLNDRAQEALEKLQGEKAAAVDEIENVSTRVGGGGGNLVVIALVVLLVLVVAVIGGVGITVVNNNNTNATNTAVANAATAAFVAALETSTAQAITATAESISATETQLALVTPTPSNTQRPEGRPTLPPTFTPTVLASPTPEFAYAQPSGLPGVIYGWGGPDPLNDGYKPLISLRLSEGGTFTLLDREARVRNIAAATVGQIIVTRWFPASNSTAIESFNPADGSFTNISDSWYSADASACCTFVDPDEAVIAGDGQTVIFTARPDITRQLYLGTIGGAGTQLTQDFNLDHRYPAITRDGGRIAFVRIDPNDNFPAHDLYVLDRGTQQITQITNDGVSQLETQPTWSPDGSLMAYAQAPGEFENHDIILRNMQNGNAINLTNDASDDLHPVFSPDGSYLAFASNRGVVQGYNIYIYELSTGTIYQLTQGEDQYFPGAWLDE